MWCKYLVQSIFSVHNDSSTCVGYLFVDIPGWARHQLGTDILGLEGLEDSERDVKIGEEEVEDGMVRDLEGWSERCGGKLVLVADIGNWCGTEMNP